MTIEKQTVNQKQASEMLGMCVNTFKKHYRDTPLFQRNVPNKTPNSRTFKYRKHDVERYMELNNWD